MSVSTATILHNMASVLDTTSATSQDIVNLVAKYNPASMLIKVGGSAVSNTAQIG